MAVKFTRDQARTLYAESGLAALPLTKERLKSLHMMLDLSMKDAGLMRGTFRMARASKIRLFKKAGGELRCKSDYFDDREAVTFNEDGFVGFASWADEINVQPILIGFLAWVSQEMESPEFQQLQNAEAVA